MRCKLPPHEVHLRYCFSDRLQDKQLLTSLESELSSEERLEVARFVRSRDRQQRLITRGMLRRLLSHYCDCSPQNWQFERGKHGRPEIVRDPAMPPLRFNVSHTTGLIAMIVGLEMDVGVDAETVHRRNNLAGIAERYFADSEVQGLRNYQGDQRQDTQWRRRFFEIWTLKEAYVKAVGKGLTLPLDQFWFEEFSVKGVQIEFQCPTPENPANAWQFDQFYPSGDHIVATAVRAGGEQPLTVRVQGEFF